MLLEEYAAREAAVRVQPDTLRLLSADVLAMRRAAADGDIGAFQGRRPRLPPAGLRRLRQLLPAAPVAHHRVQPVEPARRRQPALRR